MIYSKISIRLLLIILFFFSAVNIVLAQDNNNESVYNWFDETIGKENLALNNGVLHKNYDRTLNNQNRYFTSNDFTIGTLNYDNQDYFKVNMKYDIYEDELILNPSEESNYININLIKESVKYFILNKKKFINLNNQLPTEFLDGYYEENLIGKYFIFYIKHYKEKKELLKDNGAFIEYFYKNSFLILKDNKYIKINQKKEIIKLFPSIKKEIDDFYLLNRNLKKENEIKFMENLITYINNSIITNPK
ncbi:hypothetical protein [Flavobacterium sp.]|uniref:hypothetical protein n=1 Tax=Flavobacterium sp. TaxID=239 RepID=UPI00374CCD7C